MPGVAVDLVDAAAADDQVVARAAGEEVAGLAAVDHVVAAAAVRGDPDGDAARAGAVSPSCTAGSSENARLASITSLPKTVNGNAVGK